MATVTLARNLGRLLIKSLGLDETKPYLEGQTIDVSEDVEKELIKQSLVKSEAEIANERAASERILREPALMQGVAMRPAIAEAVKPATFSQDPHTKK